MNRKDWDYKKYGGYMDPEDNVFFGPVTVRELKRSMEVAEERLKRKNAPKKATFAAIQESDENSILNRTFDKDDDTENVDPLVQSTKEDLNRTYELDESQNPCICPQIENSIRENRVSRIEQQLNTTFTEADGEESRPHLISILSDPLKDVSNLNNTVASKQMRVSDAHNSSRSAKNAATNVSLLKKGSLLDASCATIVTGRLQTPLLEKVSKSDSVRVGNKSNTSLDKTLTNEITVCNTTPRITKLSDTFITQLVPENCLINESLNDSTHQMTPDVFRQKRNEIWQKNSPSKKSIPVPVQSKLPLLRKTPNRKCLPIQSPVANYIHRGITVKSASKTRHSFCINEMNPKSKSEQKGPKPCKIPISTNAFVKRQLQMGEQKSAAKK